MISIEQKKFTIHNGWKNIRISDVPAADMQLVLAFGSTALLKDATNYNSIKEAYPNATILMNSTSGEIMDIEVNDDTISLTAMHFESTKLKTVSVRLEDSADSFKAGYRLASGFDTNGLKSVLVISDGQLVNGSDLVMGLDEFLPKDVIITGGLAGDGSDFNTTLVGLNAPPAEGNIVGIGFYGENLTINYGSVGGWDSFGVERLVTKAEANVLYELDGKPALDVYKMYLGEYAEDLPGSALLFPLCIRSEHSEEPLVRTILGVSEQDKSLTFAGNVPKGSYAQLMKANFESLIEGASDAAAFTITPNSGKPDLALLISCVGRKLVLNQRIEEEVEIIRELYGNHTAITGFYSYGEIAPMRNLRKCELQNQTMTITAFTEA